MKEPGQDRTGAASVAGLLDSVDWSTSPLGPRAAWPVRLEAAVDMILPADTQIVLFWGPDFVALYNDAYAPTIGDKHPHALGRPAREYWGELWDDLGPLLEGVRRDRRTFAAKDRPFYIERHGFGETVYFDVSYSAVPDADGSVGGVLCIVSETTERVLAERRLRESEAALRASEAVARSQAHQLAAIYDASPIGLAVLDTELRFVHINERLAAWNGASAEAHIGRHVREIVPDLADQAIGALQQVLGGEPLIGLELVGKTPACPDTDYIWRENWVPLRDEQGTITGIAISCEDVTDERRDQRALETLNRVGAALAAEHDLERLVQMLTDAGVELTGARLGAFFHNVMDESGEGLHLFTLSGDDSSRFASLGRPRATGVLGPIFQNCIIRSDDITRDPRYGHNAPHQGMPDGHPSVTSYLGVPVVSRSGAVLGGLLFGHPEPGRFTSRHEALAVSLAAQAAVAIDNARLLADVRHARDTLERRVEERTAELRETEAALRQSQKMEAMGQLTGGVAHDFNNLLTPIIGSLDLILRKLGDDPGMTRLIDGALRSAERASTLVQRLLAFARRQPLQVSAVAVDELVDGMVPLLESTLGPQIALLVERETPLPAAQADPNQLEMALLNLAVNARDAMPAGGTLGIRLAEDMPGADRPELPAGRYVRLAVSDTGSGMDADTLTRAIEPFFSTKGVGRGTGLGLSMVHGLASQLGGTMTLSSEPDAGTTVELWLPVSTAAVPVRTASRAGVATVASGRVLLVDDEEAVRTTAAEMLVAMGYSVDHADSAATALALVERGLIPDLIISDHLMPGMTGTELARVLRAQFPETPILIVSGYADLAGLSPEFAHLTKPFRHAELAKAIASIGQAAAAPSDFRVT